MQSQFRCDPALYFSCGSPLEGHVDLVMRLMMGRAGTILRLVEVFTLHAKFP